MSFKPDNFYVMLFKYLARVYYVLAVMVTIFQVNNFKDFAPATRERGHRHHLTVRNYNALPLSSKNHYQQFEKIYFWYLQPMKGTNIQ